MTNTQRVLLVSVREKGSKDRISVILAGRIDRDNFFTELDRAIDLENYDRRTIKVHEDVLNFSEKPVSIILENSYE